MTVVAPVAHCQGKGAAMFDARIERERADRSVQLLMVSSWRATALMAIAILAIAGLGFAAMILMQ